MTIYIIFYETVDGEKGRISPMGCKTDREEMLKIAKRMKYEMKEHYKKVELRRDIYRYVESDYIEV